MIGRIARTEPRVMLRDGRFRAAGTVVVLLLLAASAAGWLDATRVRRERAAAQSITRAQWESQGEKNPHSAAHYSIYAFRPRSLLSFLDPGVDPYVGIGVWLEAHRQNDFRYRPVRDMTAAARASRGTAAFVLQWLVPLLIVTLVAPTVAGEREAGTWPLLLSLGVRPQRLVLGKLLGVSSALLVLLVPAALIGSLLLATQEAAEDDVGLRAALMAGGYLAYFAAFLLIGLATSAVARSSRLALLVMLGFWLMNALVPRVTTDLARRLYPLPSAAEMASAVSADLRQGIDGHNPEGRRLEALTARVLAQYRVSSVDELPVNFEGIVLQEGENYSNRVFDLHYDRLRSHIARQNRLHLLGALAAPLPAIQAWSLALARSDWTHQQHFAAAAERYRRRLVTTMNEELIYRSTSRAYEQNLRGRELWAATPRFQYAPPPIGQVLRLQAMSLLMLGAWCGAGALLCAWAVGRRVSLI